MRKKVKICGLGKRIEKVIFDSGDSVNDTARKIGCVRSAIYGWINEERTPDLIFIARFCDVYKVSLDWMVNG